MQRPKLDGDELDYLVIYLACALWAILFAVFVPSVIDSPLVRLVTAVIMTVTAAGSALAFFGVLNGDRIGIERIALPAVMSGFAAYLVTQIPLVIVYVQHGNTDRVPLLVFASLPVLFLNRRRRFLTHRRHQVSAVAQLHAAKDAR